MSSYLVLSAVCTLSRQLRTALMAPPPPHRVDMSARLFPQSSELQPPHSLTCRRVCPPPPFGSGEIDTLDSGRGGGGRGGPNSDEGTDTVVL
jgi:hypothetical protein